MQTAERRGAEEAATTTPSAPELRRLDGRPTCPTQGDTRPDFADFILLGTLAILMASATGIVWALV